MKEKINKKKIIAYAFVVIMIVSALAGLAALTPNSAIHGSFVSITPSDGTGSSITVKETICVPIHENGETYYTYPCVSMVAPSSTYDVGQTIHFTSSTYDGDGEEFKATYYADGTSIGSQTFTAGDSYADTSYTISAIDPVSFYVTMDVYTGSSGNWTFYKSGTSSSGEITVNSDPVPSITVSHNPADVGQLVLFNSTISGGTSPVSSSWIIYNGTSQSDIILHTSNNTSFSYTFTSAGSFLIYLKITDAAGYSTSTSINETINIAPTISISSSSNPGDVGQKILDSTSVSGGSGTYISYSYFLYNGTSTSDAELASGSVDSFSYSFSFPGTFLLVYSVTDSSNFTVSTSMTQDINSDPSVTIKSSQNPTDTGLLVEFCPVISGGTPPDSYEWEANDNTYTSKDINVSFSTAGSQTVTLTITDSNDYQATASFTETVDSSPQVKAYANMSDVDTGISIEFVSIPENGTAPFNFTWSENGIILAYTENYTTSFSSPGTYTLEITTRDSLDVYRYANVTVVVNPNPTVSISVSLNRTDANVGVTFKNVITGGTGPDTYAWYDNNVQVSTSSSFFFNTSSPGSYNISLIIKDKFGRIADSNVIDEIVVKDPLITVTYSTTPIVSESVTIHTTITGGVGNFSLSWTFTGGTTTGRNVTYAFETAGNRTFSIKLTDGSGYTNTQHFTVYVQLKIEISETAKSGKAPLTVDFDGEALGGSSYLYDWNFGDGNTSDSQSATNIFSAGNYTVTLTVTDSAGITGTDSVYIQAYPVPVTFVYTNNANITQTFYFKAIPNWDVKAPFNATWTMPNGQVLYGMNISYVFPLYASSNTISVVFSYNSSSVYGGSSYSTSITVHMVPGKINVVFTPPKYIPTGSMLDLNASASAPDSTSFTFSWNVNGSIYSGNNTDYYFASPGRYYVNLTVADSLGASETVSRIITVENTGSDSSISISVSEQSVGSYDYYTISVASLHNISEVEVFLSGSLLHITEISGNNTNQKYNLTLNQRDYQSGTFGLTIIAYNDRGGSNSRTATFTVSSIYSSNAAFNLVAELGGIGNTIEIFATLGSIIAGYLYFRHRGTTVIQEPDGYEEVGKPGKPLKLEKRGKK